MSKPNPNPNPNCNWSCAHWVTVQKHFQYVPKKLTVSGLTVRKDIFSDKLYNNTAHTNIFFILKN